MGNLTTIPNSSVLTAKQSLLLSAIAEWKLPDPPPENWTPTMMEHAIALVDQALLPSNPKAVMVAIDKLLAFGRAFNLPTPEKSVVIESYRDQLSNLPADLLERAVTETIGNWRWGNRMPMPSDIRATVEGELLRRRVLRGRAQMALRKLQTRTTNSTSRLTSTGARRQWVKRPEKTMEAAPEDDMTEAEAFEQLSEDRAAFYEKFPELRP